MHIGNVLGMAVGPLLTIVGLVVIGAIFARRAGAGSSRMWLGLAVLILNQLLTVGWAYAVPSIYSRGAIGIDMLYGGFSLLISILYLAAIALLASAAVAGRSPQQVGYLDPTRPGAPPSPYQGVGYPPTGGQSPYESPGPDGGR